MRIVKNGRQIGTLSDWLQHAGPKGGARQWKDGRSAKECAIAWLAKSQTGVPTEIHGLLTGHRDFGAISYSTAEPEVRLPFDARRGEPRNADLVVSTQDERGSIALTVEAKADETFGETVAEALAAAVERRLKNANSRGLTRVEDLCLALFRPADHREPALGDLRYQLLTATAGTLVLASKIGASRAVVLIHEFVTDQTDDTKHDANADDLDRFVQRISAGSAHHCSPGVLAGPFDVPGKPLLRTPIRLYIGKALRNLRS